MRIVRRFLWNRLKDLLVIIPMSFLVAALVWFFAEVIGGTHIEFLAWVKYIFLVSFGFSTLLQVVMLLSLLEVAHRVDASYTDVWEAVVIYRLKSDDLKDAQSFRRACSRATISRAIVSVATEALYGEKGARR